MRSLIIFSLFLFSVCFSGYSQAKKDSTKEKKIEFAPIPYISYNRTTEFEFGALPMIMYSLSEKDTISPKSISGAMYVYTTNKSSFGIAFSKLYLKEDKYRFVIAAGVGDYNAQAYFSEGFIPSGFYDFNTFGKFFVSKLERRVWRNLFLGAGYTYIEAENSFDFTEITAKSKRNGLSFFITNDNRDDVYFPTTGSLFESRYIVYPEWFSNPKESQTIIMSQSKYLSLKNSDDVLAFRLSTDLSLGDVSFEQQVVIGGREVRGYSEGKYRGDGTINFQTEYRYNPWDNIGFVAFGSVSKLWGSSIDSHNEYWYPALGFGMRYMAFKENKMRVGLDAAVGKDDWGIYFKIGEAF